MDQPDAHLEELLGGSCAASRLIADLREAYQHLRAASERLQELRERPGEERRPGPR